MNVMYLITDFEVVIINWTFFIVEIIDLDLINKKVTHPNGWAVDQLNT